MRDLLHQKERKDFKKMLNNNNKAQTVIELSIEMGYTVEETKNMIINHCTV